MHFSKRTYINQSYMKQCLDNISNFELNPKLQTFKLFNKTYLSSTQNLNHTGLIPFQNQFTQFKNRNR